MRLIDGDALVYALTEMVRHSTGEYKHGIDAARLVAMEAPAVGGWIPFVKRPLTDDEKKKHPDWCYILEGNAPEDEAEILLYRPWKNSVGYIITMDQYMNNGTECYLDGAGDIENGMFWMPLPEPPKGEKPE